MVADDQLDRRPAGYGPPLRQRRRTSGPQRVDLEGRRRTGSCSSSSRRRPASTRSAPPSRRRRTRSARTIAPTRTRSSRASRGSSSWPATRSVAAELVERPQGRTPDGRHGRARGSADRPRCARDLRQHRRSSTCRGPGCHDRQLAALQVYVRDLGKGLVMVGGPRATAPAATRRRRSRRRSRSTWASAIARNSRTSRSSSSSTSRARWTPATATRSTAGPPHRGARASARFSPVREAAGGLRLTPAGRNCSASRAGETADAFSEAAAAGARDLSGTVKITTEEVYAYPAGAAADRAPPAASRDHDRSRYLADRPRPWRGRGGHLVSERQARQPAAACRPAALHRRMGALLQPRLCRTPRRSRHDRRDEEARVHRRRRRQSVDPLSGVAASSA